MEQAVGGVTFLPRVLKDWHVPPASSDPHKGERKRRKVEEKEEKKQEEEEQEEEEKKEKADEETR